MRIILASGSPRRKQLLEQAGITFDVVVSDADETIDGDPHSQVAALAQRKAEAVGTLVAERGEFDGNTLIIAADTLVCIGDKVLGKPEDAQDAFDMLWALQGRKHTVYTGVALLRGKPDGSAPVCEVFVDAAYVYFRPLQEREIRAYIATGEPFDKAGAYGIQEKGALLIERVEGDFYTVMGLPISKLCVQLEELGVQVWPAV
ncbi:MAG: Maf family protein [Defluviitaleaceae bacterium]|nr:Maf family protein [Defluviitaleaceae bacterium]MCL2274973.1 Maf family protein [Defluviitaleaceae bacterium]